MKTKLHTALMLSIFQLIINTAFSQNVTINYQTWNHSSPPCDVFNVATNVPATINGTGSTISHVTLIGDVKYSTSDQSIQLDNNFVTASDTRGTKFRLAYSFKVGYRYIITVTSAELTNTLGTGINPYLRLDLTNNGSSGGTSCVGTESVTSNLSGNPGANPYSSTSFQDVQFAFSTALTIASSTLEVTSIPAQSVSSNSIRIRKITIAETPPAVSFNITPASVPITCGSITPVTFTVNNGGGTTGITGYTWNLGAIPNGWLLPNGSDAPATYSTGSTINSLTLTPVCGSVQKNVSAAVAANGSTYNTNNVSNVSITQPSMSISGNASFCSGTSNYSLTGQACNATNTWIVTPATGIVSFSPTTGFATTLTKVGNGTITLTANVVSCGVTSPVTIPITVGTPFQPGPVTFSLIDPTFGKLFANIQPVTGATSYNWYMNGALNTLYHGASAHFSIPKNQCDIEYDIAVEAINGCGASLQSHANAYVPCYYYYMVSPNPASGKLSVSVDQTKSAKGANATFDEVRIYDMQGNLKMNRKFNKTTSASINISSLINGDYYIEISNGANKERKLLLIRK